MKRSRQMNMLTLLTALLLVVACFGTTAADDLRGKKGLHGKQAVTTGSAPSTAATAPATSLADDPRAIIKEGKMDKTRSGFITLIDLDTRRTNSFRLESNLSVLNENPDYTDLQKDEPLSLDDVPNSSIVRLILIEGQVREIILLQRPS